MDAEIKYQENSGVFWYPTDAESLKVITMDGLIGNTILKPPGKRQRRAVVLYKHLHEAAFNMAANGEKKVKFVLVEVSGVSMAKLPKVSPRDDGIDVTAVAAYIVENAFILPWDFKILDVVSLKG